MRLWPTGVRCKLGSSNVFLITMPPELSGSGKLGTPCERMQWANASAC